MESIKSKIKMKIKRKKRIKGSKETEELGRAISMLGEIIRLVKKLEREPHVSKTIMALDNLTRIFCGYDRELTGFSLYDMLIDSVKDNIKKLLS